MKLVLGKLIWQFSWNKTLDFGNPSAEVFFRKGVLKIWSKFTRECPCRSAISIKLLCKFIKITLPHGCSPVNLMHIFRTPFLGTPLDGCFFFGKLVIHAGSYPSQLYVMFGYSLKVYLFERLSFGYDLITTGNKKNNSYFPCCNFVTR